MIANIHPSTGIPFGVIQLSNIDGDIQDMLTFNGYGIDVQYICLMADFAKRLGYTAPASTADESGFQYYTRVREELFKLDYDWEEFHLDNEDFTGNQFAFEYEKVIGEINTDSNIMMVFESPTIVKVNPCSICYPNAGDLDNPNDDGIEAYGVPESWKYEA